LNRFGSFAKAVSTSWGAIAVTTAYSLATVPLALGYLGVERFGLWALLLQLVGYFTLIEIGMTGAAARLLIDHKDDKQGDAYISTLSTSNLIFLAQAIIIFITGWLVASPLARLFEIPSDLAADFTRLVILTAAVAALGTTTRIFGALLYANTRIDLFNWSGMAALMVGFAALWTAFAAGFGLYALVISQLAAWGTGSLFTISICFRLGFLRPKHLISGLSWSRAKALINFGKDMFAFNLGTQLLDASQIMIVTRTMGLDAAAIWAVSTKLFTFVFQLVAKIEGSAIVYFAEMMVRREQDLLRRRFRQVYQLSTALAVAGVAVAIASNHAFVALWANASLFWSTGADILLGLLVATNCAIRCGADLIIHTKRLGALRFIYFIEAALFLGLAFAASSRFGFYGILVPALACALSCRALYVVSRVSGYLGVSALDVGILWIRRSFLLSAVLVPATTWISVLADQWSQSAITSLSMSLAVSCALAVTLVAIIGLPSDVRLDLLDKVRSKRKSL